MVRYNTEDFKSVITYIKEKAKLSRAISHCNGIIYGVNTANKSEQAGFELKNKAISDKERYTEQMDALKKAVQPLFAKYGGQMKSTKANYEVNGNKI